MLISLQILFEIVQTLVDRLAKDGANGVPNFLGIRYQEDCLRFIGECILCEEEEFEEKYE